MCNHLYLLFNNLTNRYQSAMSFESDAKALNVLQDDRIPETQRLDTKEYTLCRVGDYNIETGELNTYPPVRLVWSEKVTKPVTEAK